MYVCVYIYIYIYMHMHLSLSLYIYIYSYITCACTWPSLFGARGRLAPARRDRSSRSAGPIV